MAHASTCTWFTPHCADCGYCLTKYKGQTSLFGAPYCNRHFRRRLGLSTMLHFLNLCPNALTLEQVRAVLPYVNTRNASKFCERR
jgi:hypothetical protein